ncbi:hypothetical protein [Morganella psychrotolerans]|uniref:hypothetical protein n=1 Tax=Morganella psychrotolerans TaxID=368603 RepID=UPI0039AFC455
MLIKKNISCYFSATILFFIVLFSSVFIKQTAEGKSKDSSRINFLSAESADEFYRVLRSRTAVNRAAILNRLPDEVVMQYADNRLALFNQTLADDPSGKRCFRGIYPENPAIYTSAVQIKPFMVQNPVSGLSGAEIDALYMGIFLRLRHTYGDLIDEKDADIPEKDAILTCEIKSALYQSILQLDPHEGAGLLRYLWVSEGIF